MINTIYDNDYMDMNIGIAYRFLDNKTVLTKMHNHNYFEYFIITNGEIIHEVNGKNSVLKTGNMVFIRPEDCHKYQINAGKSCKMINVSFRTLHFDNVMKYFASPVLTEMLRAEDPPTIFLSATQITALKKKHYMLNVSHNFDELVIFLKTLIIDVFSYFIMKFDMQYKNSSEKWLQSVLSQMDTPENIEEGLPALIRYSGFSHGHLCRVMKKELDITPIMYITNLRLQYAANLLATTDYDILSIAVRLGFSSLSHFSTIFKTKFGLSPSKYRNINSNMHVWK